MFLVTRQQKLATGIRNGFSDPLGVWFYFVLGIWGLGFGILIEKQQMEEQMTTSEAREIIKGAGYGIMATDVDGQPRVRPMAFVVTDDFRLLSSTFKQSGKAKELARNPRVEICFVDGRKYQLRVEGRADVSGGPEKKRELLALNPHVKKHFTDEHNSNFVLIEIIPTRVRWMPPGFGEYRQVEVG